MFDYEEAIRREIASIVRVIWQHGSGSDAVADAMRFCARVAECVRERDHAWRMIRNENARIRGAAFFSQMRRKDGDVVFNFCEKGNPHHCIRCEKSGLSGAINLECARIIVEISVLGGGEIETCICRIAHDTRKLWSMRDELGKNPVMKWCGVL